ncbi:MAG TPA: sigma-54-dependent Fis family transcriptional regulator, partial [Caldithrix abyssi]|nr:sigma-54-dependent Fis family transcriptional regulator [Caldithrix abyssi]
VDDEIEMTNGLKKILSKKEGLGLTVLNDSRQALDLLKHQRFDLVLSDLKMTPVSGIEVLKAAHRAHPDTPVIMLSGYGSIETSVDAMREGAFDFLEKPFTAQKLFEVIDRALNLSYDRALTDTEQSGSEKKITGIIYQSREIGDLIALVERVAPANMNILITGESGTGKELFARLIHKLSARSTHTFVPVNCGALPENLFESELFGHEQGAFTGASKTKPGLLEFANHGTFFLDEIGDLQMNMQIKLLRMLEERTIRRVGGRREIDIDVRVIAATNKDLEKAVKENTFRQDLFYRLNTIAIHIPPLRERKEDILPLANYFLSHLARQEGGEPRRFSPEAEEALLEYEWPGNVREMQNLVQRAFYMATGQVIQKQSLPLPCNNNEADFRCGDVMHLPYHQAKEAVLEQFEVAYLKHHLGMTNNNISKTAQRCGLDRRSIHRLLKKYRIDEKD